MRYKLLGRSGLRVSELCLGTMTFGTEWGWGADQAESHRIFDTFGNAGGTFLDTANFYTGGTSERWVGDCIRADRDHWVVATKYTLKDRHGDLNFGGNHRKNLFRSVQESLQRLGTSYLDLLWVHLWDFATPVEEVMRGLDDLVSRGLVHYVGISDTPAWVVAQANTLADFRGWSPFVALQIEYSLIERTPERDLLPMARALGLAVTPWGALGGGVLTGKYLQQQGTSAGRIMGESPRRNERNSAIAQAVVATAQELEVLPGQVALAWCRQRDPLMIPIVGARTTEQLQETLGTLDFSLPEEQLQALNEASQIELGFPHDFLSSDSVRDNTFGGLYHQLDNHHLR
jgi:aryl-alcohol dehydrogenase-like predicted oxidoreductase